MAASVFDHQHASICQSRSLPSADAPLSPMLE
jgi:hypothetical protein